VVCYLYVLFCADLLRLLAVRNISRNINPTLRNPANPSLEGSPSTNFESHLRFSRLRSRNPDTSPPCWEVCKNGIGKSIAKAVSYYRTHVPVLHTVHLFPSPDILTFFRPVRLRTPGLWSLRQWVRGFHHERQHLPRGLELLYRRLGLQCVLRGLLWLSGPLRRRVV